MFLLLCLLSLLVNSGLAQENNNQGPFRGIVNCYFKTEQGSVIGCKDIAYHILRHSVEGPHIKSDPFFNETGLTQLDQITKEKVSNLWNLTSLSSIKRFLIVNKSLHNLVTDYVKSQDLADTRENIENNLKDEYVSFKDAVHFFPYFDLTIKFDLPYYESVSLFGYEVRKQKINIIPLYITCSVVHFFKKIDRSTIQFPVPEWLPTIKLNLVISMYFGIKNRKYNFGYNEALPHYFFFTDAYCTMEKMKQIKKAVAHLNEKDSALFEQYRKLIAPLFTTNAYFGKHVGLALYELEQQYIALRCTFGEDKIPCVHDLAIEWQDTILQYIPEPYRSLPNPYQCPLYKLDISIERLEEMMTTDVLIHAFTQDISCFHIYKILQLMNAFYHHPLCQRPVN